MNKIKIAKTLEYMQWAILLILGLLAAYKMYDNIFLLTLQSHNRLIGQAAAYIFLISMLPGSILRFGLFKKTMAQFVFWRRNIGMLMYNLAFAHFILIIDLVPFISQFGGVISLLTISGSISFFILTPVFFTSSNFAQKILKKNWKTVQRIGYLAFIPLITHFGQTNKILLVYAYSVTLTIIIASYIYSYYQKNHASKRPNPQNN